MTRIMYVKMLKKLQPVVWWDFAFNVIFPQNQKQNEMN